jgi:phage terminase large subunit-like protein
MNNSQHLQELLNLPRVQRELSNRSYYEFLKMAWEVLEPQTPLIDNWHIKYLCNKLQKEVERISRNEHKTKDLIINIPPRSMKSGIVTIYLNAWAWLNYPHIKFITSSYSQDLSTEHSLKTRTLIESEWYKSLLNKQSFTMSTDQNIKTKFANSKSGYRYATSVGGTVTGSGADIFIADDPHKVKESTSETIRKSVIDWWKNTVFSRLNNQEVGLRIIVMQRVHEEDLTGEMLKTGRYEHINIPAELTKETPEELKQYYTDGLFFPKRFTPEVLGETKQIMGAREYAGQFLQQPSPDDGDIIKREWFQYFTRDKLPEDLVVHYYSDTAYGKEQSDKSATVVYSVYNKNVYVWAVWFWNLAFPDFIKRYVEMVNLSGYSYGSRCRFEPKASGISVVQQLKDMGGLNVMEDKASSDSKVSRVTSASASIESGRVFLLSGGVGIEELVEESIKFPNAKNDDGVDALSSAIGVELIGKANPSVIDRSVFGL